jgi:transposase
MARRRISMRKLKETLRLKYECRLTQRQISRAVNVAQSTVHEYLARAERAGLTWPLPDGLDDEELNARLFPPADRPAGAAIPVPDWREVREQLCQKGVTRQLLWQEYIEQYPDGYGYSRFCELYHEWAKALSPTMRLNHKAGERAFIDYSGPKMPYLDPATGEIPEASLFVAVLGASNPIYCEAQSAQDLGNWIGGHVNAFTHWGGVPELLVPDYVPRNIIRLLCPARLCARL